MDIKKSLLATLLVVGLLVPLAFSPGADDQDDQAGKAKKKNEPKSPAAPENSFRRGVTISCWGWGAEWDAPGMAEAMKEIQGLGGNWISFHPYGSIRNNGSIRHRSTTRDNTVLNPLKAAKKLGVKVMLIPHIGYWGSRFEWRGAITFEDEAGWDRFFESYTDFIVTQATMAQEGGAELFSIGIEYKQTLAREKQWRALIAKVREVYKGKILYAANWDSYNKVPFWDAVDLIGVQAYFPLTQAEDPSREQISAGWDQVLQTLGEFSKKHKKKIVFTELGYNRSSQAAARPWEYRQGGKNAAQIKLRCMETALSAIEKVDFLKGVFLWKWFPARNPRVRDFTLQYDDMRKVIRKAWKSATPKKGKKTF